jgi:hypothetical protein
MKQLGIMVAVLAGPVAAFAESGNCQHPYCSATPSDVTAGYQGVLPDGISAESVASSPDMGDSVTPAERLKEELQQVGVARFTAPDYKPGTLRHIVLFRYVPTASAEQKAQVRAHFLDLQRLCQRNGQRYVVSIESGAQNSGEGADQGLEEGCIVTFRSEGDRNYYVGQPVVTDANYYEPAHQAFKDFVAPLLAANGALVFDFAIGR